MQYLRGLATLALVLTLMPNWAAKAGEPTNPPRLLVNQIPRLDVPGLLSTPIGLTREETPIPAYITAADLNLHTARHRVLLVAGLDGSRATVQALAKFLAQFYRDENFQAVRGQLALSAVLCGNPERYRLGSHLSNSSGGQPVRAFPPPPDAYTSRTVPESQYLWRWLAMHAPEYVIELVEGDSAGKTTPAAGSLIDGLNKSPAKMTRTAFTWAIRSAAMQPLAGLEAELKAIASRQQEPSARWLELGRLAERSPTEVSEELARVYGQALPKIRYTISLALVGRLRLGAATGDPSQQADVQRIVAPYLAGGPTVSSKSAGSELAGYLIFAELCDQAGKSSANYPACLRMVRAVADLGFDSAGQPRDAFPGHNEMSDGVFMGCPILAAAGHLTGDSMYYQMCLRHLRYLQRLVLRSDGLYRNSPLCDAAWGRGNGFPALGLAWVLSDWPASEPGRDDVLAAFRNHVAALLPHQDVTGCWHQVIDHPESYREFSCTCMITWAMARGVRLGLLERERFEPAIRRGWQAIKLRTQPDGVLADVCVSTGKQPSLRDYFDRPANWGRDERGGAMALLLATEMLEYERRSQQSKSQ